MSTLKISHADWELLEDVPRGSAVFTPTSSTALNISVLVGGKAGLFTVTGNFTSPQGMSTADWLAAASGTVTAIRFSIDGVEQLNATDLSLNISEVIDEASNKIHDIIEMAIGDKVSVTGSGEDDHLSGHGGDDSISGGQGNDDLFGDLGDDSLLGGDGIDTLSGGDGDDSLSGGNGNDSLYGSSGNDQLNGGAGTDYMSGGSGNDAYYVSSDLDRISESSVSTGGYDTEYAAVSESALASNIEKLVLTGTAVSGVGNGGNNALIGNASANSLSGGSGNDTIAGGIGNDTCVGGVGDDRLTGGRGTDHLSGDAGHDIFDFNGLFELGQGSGVRDVISNFVRGEDRIDLSTIDANLLVLNDQAFHFVSTYSANASGQVKYSNGVIQISTDADSQVEYEIGLIGVAPTLLSATDFIL